MAKCISCGRRKGKRACPALHGSICPKCCGTKRIVEIQCPPDCRYLGHEKYQGERLMGEGRDSPHHKRYRNALRRGRIHFETLLLLDVLVADFLRRQPDYPPAAIRQGLGFVRRLASPLETVESVEGEFERFLRERVESILAEGALDRDVLGQAAEETQAFLGENLNSEEEVREYLRVVAAFTGGARPPEPSSANSEADPDSGPDSGDGGGGDTGGGLIITP